MSAAQDFVCFGSVLYYSFESGSSSFLCPSCKLDRISYFATKNLDIQNKYGKVRMLIVLDILSFVRRIIAYKSAMTKPWQRFCTYDGDNIMLRKERFLVDDIL
jgi:hypothetical protein